MGALGLAASERFLNWQVASRRVVRLGGQGVDRWFDAMIGKPPWDRMKLQTGRMVRVPPPRDRHGSPRRRPEAHDRRTLEGGRTRWPKTSGFASDRAAAGARVARTSGDYPLLARGDLNLYSLFVERAMTLVKPDGMVGLLVPSGIASDKMAAPFFKSVATEGRLKVPLRLREQADALRHHALLPGCSRVRFKFCVFVASPAAGESEAGPAAPSILHDCVGESQTRSGASPSRPPTSRG